MASRKQLKNLACGIAGKFASRNNDLDGYWALGLMYANANHCDLDRVRLDLVNGITTPSFEFDSRLIAVFRQYMEEQIRKIDLEGHVRAAATVEVAFNVESEQNTSLVRTTWGEPFQCEITITDDLGHEHTATVCGYCGKHDSIRERRSTRSFPS